MRVWCVVRQLLAGSAALVSASLPAAAQSSDYEANILPTPSLYGGVGLLDMRNARFMPDGYLWMNVDVKQPDTRVSINWQALPWMETTFRYAVNYALAPIGQRALYDRSFDIKLRLFTEGEYTPQIALGLQDFIGTGVYSAEYLVASKRYGPVDLTAGMGWGRLASRGTFSNPLGLIDPAFYTRPVDTSPTGGVPLFTSYFRGPKVGIFGGIEYETPLPNLTAKLEYSTDDYAAESSYTHNPAIHPMNYAPVPVNAGLSYRLWNAIDLGVSVIGGRELAVDANIIMNPTVPNWPYRLDPPPPFVARPDGAGQPLVQLRLRNESSPDTWPVHFVDLTMRAGEDGRPPDPSLFHEEELPIADVFQKAGLHVTDGWIAGDTLVAQVDASGPTTTLCARLLRAGSLPTPEIMLVGRDWNPIATCTTPVAMPTAQAAPAPPSWQPDTLAKMRRAIEDQKLVVQGISIQHGVVKVEIENGKYFRDAEAISRVARALSAVAPADIAAFEITTTFAHMPLTTVTLSRAEIDAAARGEVTPAEFSEIDDPVGCVAPDQISGWRRRPAVLLEHFPFHSGGIVRSEQPRLYRGWYLRQHAYRDLARVGAG